MLISFLSVVRTALMELEDMDSVAEKSVAAEGGELSMSYQMLGRMYELHQDQDGIHLKAKVLENCHENGTNEK